MKLEKYVKELINIFYLILGHLFGIVVKLQAIYMSS